MARRLNIVLAILLVALVAASWGLRRDYTQRNLELLPGMVTTQRFNDQSANPVLPGGMTLQTPARGSVARGLEPLHYGTTPEEAVRAGAELLNPIADSSQPDLDRAEVVFTTFCQPCHGPGALGDGPVTKRGFPPPPSLMAEKARKLADGQIFHIITFGQGNMPSLSSQVPRLDRWRVIKKIRLLQRAPVAAAPTKGQP